MLNARKPKWLSYIAWFILVLVGVFYGSDPASAQKLSKEDKIKASYIYNFIRFIQWPHSLSNTQTSINICVFSDNPDFVKAFQPVLNKKVRGQKLSITQLSQLKAISSCHLLYLAENKHNYFTKFLSKPQAFPILSVSDHRSFCAQGGMICLVKSKGRIKVEINLKVAKAAGFNISSNLLEVATIVSSR